MNFVTTFISIWVNNLQILQWNQQQFYNMSAYTQQEINTIINCVSKYPTNLSIAFKEASEIINRTEKGIIQCYYNKIKKTTPVHSLATQNGYVVNVKNTPTPKDESHELRLSLVKDILKKMSRNEKKEVLSIILNL